MRCPDKPGKDIAAHPGRRAIPLRAYTIRKSNENDEEVNAILDSVFELIIGGELGTAVLIIDSLHSIPACTVRGDVNGDGSIDVSDVVAFIDHHLSNILLGGDDIYKADCNGDGQTTVPDASGNTLSQSVP
jgi:hypothetical protein